MAQAFDVNEVNTDYYHHDTSMEATGHYTQQPTGKNTQANPSLKNNEYLDGAYPPLGRFLTSCEICAVTKPTETFVSLEQKKLRNVIPPPHPLQNGPSCEKIVVPRLANPLQNCSTGELSFVSRLEDPTENGSVEKAFDRRSGNPLQNGSTGEQSFVSRLEDPTENGSGEKAFDRRLGNPLQNGSTGELNVVPQLEDPTENGSGEAFDRRLGNPLQNGSTGEQSFVSRLEDPTESGSGEKAFDRRLGNPLQNGSTGEQSFVPQLEDPTENGSGEAFDRRLGDPLQNGSTGEQSFVSRLEDVTDDCTFTRMKDVDGLKNWAHFCVGGAGTVYIAHDNTVFSDPECFMHHSSNFMGFNPEMDEINMLCFPCYPERMPLFSIARGSGIFRKSPCPVGRKIKFFTMFHGKSKSKRIGRKIKFFAMFHGKSKSKRIGRKIKFFAMFHGKSKLKRKKIHTKKESTQEKCLSQFTEVIHDTRSIIEGPAEIPLMQPPRNARSRERNRHREPRDVEADGAISDIASDPPGQQTRYISPGDIRREAYRVSTFEQFTNKAVQAPVLAKHGFVFTGFSDRVKCFSCGRTIENWTAADNPMDRKWHKNDCALANGLPSGNVPLGGLFNSSFSNVMAPSAARTTDLTPSYSSQNTNLPFRRDSDDQTEFQRGGSYSLQPGQSITIGPTTPNPPTTRPPARNPPRQWRMANVISSDHKRHLTNLYLNRELDRLASFCRWPTGRPNISPVSLAEAGFFYLGDMDRTQCFSCGGVLRNWTSDDIAMAEHRTHFPSCRFVVGVEQRNVPIPFREETPRELAQKYPCRFPMNPHMRSEPSRVQTFDRRWPVGRTRAQPQEIAEAGFFFLGERDRVKCWYCNGGLQNWEYDDIPWVEHAKWFPNCQFLLAKKGQKFVHDHLSLCPHLPRPIISRQDGAAVDTSTATPHSLTPEERPSSGQDVPPPRPRVRAPSPPPAIIDPQVEQRKRMERVDKEMNEGEAVTFVKAMGYEETLIRKALVDKLDSGTAHDAENIFDGTAALLDAVMKAEEDAKQEQEAAAAQAAMTAVSSASQPTFGFPSVVSNYSSFQPESMDTSASLGHLSGVHNVSGFHIDSDDEDIDLYGGESNGPSTSQPIGAVGGITSLPSLGQETKLSSFWSDVPSDPESMKDFIEQKKEERLCKICFTETADMVFIPCSHMVCCMTCTQALRTCPVCRKRIEKAIKTYTK